jgi:hypothetical protein
MHVMHASLRWLYIYDGVWSAVISPGQGCNNVEGLPCSGNGDCNLDGSCKCDEGYAEESCQSCIPDFLPILLQRKTKHNDG